MLFPIMIPSKGRAETATMPQLCENLPPSSPWLLVVEPQDAKGYLERYPNNVVVLPKNDQGLWYARNEVVSIARDLYSKHFSWIWMIDDDVKGFYTVADQRCHPGSMQRVLQDAQEVFAAQPNVALAALEYQQFAWAARNTYKRNGYCDVVTALHLRRTAALRYRPFFKEDRDFAMQVVASGLDTLRLTQLAFSCPAIGSKQGGLYNLYQDAEFLAESCRKMVAAWPPGYCQHVLKKNGMSDVRINWKRLRPQL